MSFCRPAKEIHIFESEWIPNPLSGFYGDHNVENMVLAIRNGSIKSFMYSDEYSEIEKLELTSVVEDVKDMLVANGFIRPEMLNYGNPEPYFVAMYLIKLDIAFNYYSEIGMEEDFEEIIMPYFFSNEAYERYEFSYERLEAIINVVSNFLEEEELYQVALDIRSMGMAVCKSDILEEAKKKMVEKGNELMPLLEQVFAML